MTRLAAEQKWDAATDVVVVGFGVAGAAAAIEARDGGAEVIALDRYNGGGASAISGGIFYAGGGTKIQQQAGVDDSVENMFRYLSWEVGDAVSERTLRRFCAESAGSVEWLQQLGVPFSAQLCPYKTSYPNNDYYLYFSGSEAAGGAQEHASPSPRGHRAHGKGTSGRKLFAPMEDAAKKKGVIFRPATRVTSLITGQGGKIVGVVARTMATAPAPIRATYMRMAAASAKPGVYAPQLRRSLEKALAKLEAKYSTEMRIHARRGVVLAGGGFIDNRKMLKQYAPEFVAGLPLGTAGDDGGAINMGIEVGGAVDKMNRISVWRFITPASAMLGSLFVGREGIRWVDESRYGAALGEALVRRNGGVGWLLADQKIVDEAKSQLQWQPLWFQRIQAETMMRVGAHSGDSIAEIGEAAGVDVVKLQSTVAEHNAAIQAGTEDPLKKTDVFRTLIDTPPYYLFDVSVRPQKAMPFDSNPCPMLSLGGLVVDESTSEVLDTAGDPIRGLYAVGRTAVGICSNSYVSGLSLADCVFSGRRAGGHLAAVGSSNSQPDLGVHDHAKVPDKKDDNNRA